MVVCITDEQGRDYGIRDFQGPQGGVGGKAFSSAALLSAPLRWRAGPVG
jgi:hypothetical protein